MHEGRHSVLAGLGDEGEYLTWLPEANICLDLIRIAYLVDSTSSAFENDIIYLVLGL